MGIKIIEIMDSGQISQWSLTSSKLTFFQVWLYRSVEVRSYNPQPTWWAEPSRKLMQELPSIATKAVAQGGTAQHHLRPRAGSCLGSNASEEKGGSGRYRPHLTILVHTVKSIKKADNMVRQSRSKDLVCINLSARILKVPVLWLSLIIKQFGVAVT